VEVGLATVPIATDDRAALKLDPLSRDVAFHEREFLDPGVIASHLELPSSVELPRSVRRRARRHERVTAVSAEDRRQTFGVSRKPIVATVTNDEEQLLRTWRFRRVLDRTTGL
jgi:hypothetical protein